MYDPHSTKYEYPESTDAHYLKVKKNNGLVFDGNYPYIDRSGGFKFKQFWVRVLLNIIVFPMCIPYMGLRIKNRKNLKKFTILSSISFVSNSTASFFSSI